MPTYDYRCQSCEHQFTAMHKISEAAPHCPECGGEVKKLLSAPAVVSGGKHQEMPCGAPVSQGCGSGMCGHGHH